MSRILITGAAGFIGSHLTDRLIADGHYVDGIDNFQTGLRENLAHHFADGRSSPGAEHGCGNHGNGNFWTGDVSGDWYTFYPEPGVQTVKGDPLTHDHPVAVGPLCASSGPYPDVIVHCAASYDDRLKWHRDTRTNVLGGINVAIAAKKWNARVIYFQTALVYGTNPYAHDNAPDVPYPLRPDAPWSPENSYAISKGAAEQYLRHSGVPLLTLRLANIYGPRNLSGPVPTFYKRLTEGAPCTVTDTRRDFVYINDLVDLVAQAVESEATGTYHVATGADYSIGEMYDTVVDALDMVGAAPEPARVERGADDAPTILLDPAETLRDFGWRATTDLDEGIGDAVAWYREHGVERTFTHLADEQFTVKS